MKNKQVIIIVFGVLALAALACGTSDDVVVREPSVSDEVSSQVTENSNEIVESTPKPTATKKVGTARSNPAPAGSEIIVGDVSLQILDAIRPANDIVMAADSYNKMPEDGYEYIILEIKMTCELGSDYECSVYPFVYFTIIGNSGVVTDPDYRVDEIDGSFERMDTKFYGGTTIIGKLTFIISVDETDMLLVYDKTYSSQDPVYLEIPVD